MSKIKTGDLVQVISGADRGKTGHVIAVDRAKSRVRVEGVRMQKHHTKPGSRGAQQGGIIEQEGYVADSNARNRAVLPDRGELPGRTPLRAEEYRRRAVGS